MRSNKDQAWLWRAAGIEDRFVSQRHAKIISSERKETLSGNLGRLELDSWRRSNHSDCGWRLSCTADHYL